MNDKIIGTTVSKKITVNILNDNNEIDLENKTIIVSTGCVLENETEEIIPLGTYIIEKSNDKEVKNKTSFVGYDSMIKFNTNYEDIVEYPISLYNYLKSLCTQVGLELQNESIINGEYEIKGNPFKNGETNKTVLSNIAQLCGGFAKINRNNKVEIITLQSELKISKGNNIHINNSIEMNSDIQIDGKSIQNGEPTQTNPIDIINVEGQDGSIGLKQTGKNLFDKDNASFFNGYLASSSGKIVINSNDNSVYIECKPNTTYTIQKNKSKRFRLGTFSNIPTHGNTATNKNSNDNATSLTITSGANDNYLLVYYYNTSDTYTEQEIRDSIQIEEGSTATTYEQYKETIYSIDLQGNTLKSIGDIKDKLLIDTNGNVIVEKNIEEITLDGNEEWVKSSKFEGSYFTRDLLDGTYAFAPIQSTHFIMANISKEEDINDNYIEGTCFIETNLGTLNLYSDGISTLDDFRTWLSTNKPKIQYKLAKSKYINLGQIESVKLQNGINNFGLLTNIETNMELGYMPTVETDNLEIISPNNYDSSFTKNKKYGYVNSLIIRLSDIEGENVTIEDSTNIDKYGLTEITLEDNYFLISAEERRLVSREIWNNIKYLYYLPFKTSYYGYPYLDAGDKIKIRSIDGNEYISYVLNHKIKYNGVYTGEIETSALTKTQTAYKNTNTMQNKFQNVEYKIDKINGKMSTIVEEQEVLQQEDKKLNNNYQDIVQKLGDYATTDDVITVDNKVSTLQESTDYYIGVTEDIKVNGVSKVSTETGFTFDREGLKIEKTGAKVKSKLDEKSLEIKDATGSSQETLLYAGYKEDIGETIVETKNLTVNKYLLIGKYSRMEDYIDENNNKCTGVFWIGS